MTLDPRRICRRIPDTCTCFEHRTSLFRTAMHTYKHFNLASLLMLDTWTHTWNMKTVTWTTTKHLRQTNDGVCVGCRPGSACALRAGWSGPANSVFCFRNHYSIPLLLMSGKCRPGWIRVGCADWSGPVLCADAALLIFSRNDYNRDVRAFSAMISMRVTITRLAVLFIILPARVCDRCNVSHTSYY